MCRWTCEVWLIRKSRTVHENVPKNLISNSTNMKRLKVSTFEMQEESKEKTWKVGHGTVTKTYRTAENWTLSVVVRDQYVSGGWVCEWGCVECEGVWNFPEVTIGTRNRQVINFYSISHLPLCATYGTVFSDGEIL